jgi:hypothetical protein
MAYAVRITNHDDTYWWVVKDEWGPWVSRNLDMDLLTWDTQAKAYKWLYETGTRFTNFLKPKGAGIFEVTPRMELVQKGWEVNQ